jgi:hypothetical protein
MGEGQRPRKARLTGSGRVGRAGRSATAGRGQQRHHGQRRDQNGYPRHGAAPAAAAVTRSGGGKFGCRAAFMICLLSNRTS